VLAVSDRTGQPVDHGRRRSRSPRSQPRPAAEGRDPGREGLTSAPPANRRRLVPSPARYRAVAHDPGGDTHERPHSGAEQVRRPTTAE
jgi:hypothetical protein